LGIRVHELAKELKKSNREVSDRLRKLEIVAKSNLASISPEDANRVRVSFGKDPLPLPKPKKAKKPAAKHVEKKPAAKKAAAKKAEKPAAKKPAGKKLEKPSEIRAARKAARR
jgi:translation initiation factor IF-2